MRKTPAPDISIFLVRHKSESWVDVEYAEFFFGAHWGNKVFREEPRNGRAIDIEPFGVIVHSTGPSPSGVFIHDGNWEGRTTDAPFGFWEEVSKSGIGDYFLTNPPEGQRSGTLAQLPPGHRGAFDAIIGEVRAREDRAKP